MTAWRFLFLSICLHLVIWFLLMNRPPLKFPDQKKAVDVTIIEKQLTKPNHQRFVRQALPPLDMLKPEPPDHPRFLSEKDQNVKKEMRARNSGLTQNRPPAVTAQPFRANQSGSPLNKRRHILAKNGEGVPAQQGRAESSENSRLTQLGQRLFSGASTEGEYLPDVSEGPITALNTERFVYYSFFSRIEERIRPIWERNVQETHVELAPQVQKELTRHDWVTGIEVVLDDQGHYLTTIVQQSSGITEIDQDAVRAFREAAIFPNPPKGMIQEDGRIHLKYAFIVQESPDSDWAQK